MYLLHPSKCPHPFRLCYLSVIKPPVKQVWVIKCAAACCECQGEESACFMQEKCCLSITLLYFELFIPHSAESMGEKKRRNAGKTVVEKLRWSEKGTKMQEVNMQYLRLVESHSSLYQHILKFVVLSNSRLCKEAAIQNEWGFMAQNIVIWKMSCLNSFAMFDRTVLQWMDKPWHQRLTK